MCLFHVSVLLTQTYGFALEYIWIILMMAVCAYLEFHWGAYTWTLSAGFFYTKKD